MFVYYKCSIYFDRIGISEEIYVNKIGKSKECNICHCWTFLTNALNFNQMSAIDAVIY